MQTQERMILPLADNGQVDLYKSVKVIKDYIMKKSSKHWHNLAVYPTITTIDKPYKRIITHETLLSLLLAPENQVEAHPEDRFYELVVNKEPIHFPDGSVIHTSKY